MISIYLTVGITAIVFFFLGLCLGLSIGYKDGEDKCNKMLNKRIKHLEQLSLTPEDAAAITAGIKDIEEGRVKVISPSALLLWAKEDEDYG